MCGRYTLRQAEQLPLRFEASATPEVRAALTPRFNIAPTQAVPIVTEARAGERAIEFADWGLMPHRGGGKRFLAFNLGTDAPSRRRQAVPGLQRARRDADGTPALPWVAAALALPDPRRWLHRVAKGGKSA